MSIQAVTGATTARSGIMFGLAGSQKGNGMGVKDFTTEELLAELRERGELEEEEEEEEESWPKRYTQYLHASKAFEDEEMTSFAAKQGWFDPEDGGNNREWDNFRGMGYEVELTYEVNEDGTFEIVAVDGYALSGEKLDDD